MSYECYFDEMTFTVFPVGGGGGGGGVGQLCVVFCACRLVFLG